MHTIPKCCPWYTGRRSQLCVNSSFQSLVESCAICRRTDLAARLTIKTKLLENLQRKPDPRQKAPEHQKKIEDTSQAIAKLVGWASLQGFCKLSCRSHACICMPPVNACLVFHASRGVVQLACLYVHILKVDHQCWIYSTRQCQSCLLQMEAGKKSMQTLFESMKAHCVAELHSRELGVQVTCRILYTHCDIGSYCSSSVPMRQQARDLLGSCHQSCIRADRSLSAQLDSVKVLDACAEHISMQLQSSCTILSHLCFTIVAC